MQQSNLNQEFGEKMKNSKTVKSLKQSSLV